MTQQSKVRNYFLALQVSLQATDEEVEQSYKALRDGLMPGKFSTSLGRSQAERALLMVEEAYMSLIDPMLRLRCGQEVATADDIYGAAALKPLLGHLCVSAGIISYEELTDAIEAQMNIDLPLGQVLQERALITQTELEGMLMGQKLFGAPRDPLDLETRRLLALDAVTLDMVKIAILDRQAQFQKSIPELLIRRGFLDFDFACAVGILPRTGARPTQ